MIAAANTRYVRRNHKFGIELLRGALWGTRIEREREKRENYRWFRIHEKDT
jgi:hypothetical protein